MNQSSLLLNEMNLYTIPAYYGFFDSFVSWLIKNYSDSKLSQITILVQSPEAVKKLQHSFLKYTKGKAILLPKIFPIVNPEEEEILLNDFLASKGDIYNDIPFPVDVIEQKILLTDLIQKYYLHRSNQTITSSAHLAKELICFLAELRKEQIEPSKLLTLAEDETAIHWQELLQLLQIIVEIWPTLLASKNLTDPVNYQNLLLERQANYLKRSPPLVPIIAIGISEPSLAVVNLIKSIIDLPKGYLIFQNLDISLDDDIWKDIDEHHPQHSFKLLLKQLNLDRTKFQIFSEHSYNLNTEFRLKLFNEIMRPANSCEAWQNLNSDNFEAASLSDLNFLVAENIQEEASLIALILREYLEDPSKTAALVTNERNLAKWVISILAKWNINLIDLSGEQLKNTPAAVYFRLIGQVVSNDFTPISLLSLLKSPYTCCGFDKEEFNQQTQILEKTSFRGIRITPGFAGIYENLAKSNNHGLIALIQKIEHALQDFTELLKGNNSFTSLLNAHINLAEKLADDPNMFGSKKLWHGEIGEKLSDFLSKLCTAGKSLFPSNALNYISLLEEMFSGVMYKPAHNTHPRLSIMSPNEAKFSQYDLVIIGGLNEGSWPTHSAPSPWLSTKMRGKLGLPTIETKIGLSAHDFICLLGNKEIYLTRSRKVGGVEMVPSRWLLRSETLFKKLKYFDLINNQKWHNTLNSLNIPKLISPCSAPSPIPPLKFRPKRLSVTQVEKLLRDPYAIYVKEILKLKVLDDIDTEPGLLEFGNFVHKALEYYSRSLDANNNLYNQLIASGERALIDFIHQPAVKNLWWPRYLRIAAWFSERELERLKHNSRDFAEISGKYILNNYNFTITGKADRIEIKENNIIKIIDFKTGTVPELGEIKKGLALQVALEALIAQNNGFSCQLANINYIIEKLAYIHVSGGVIAGQEKELDVDAQELIKQTKTKLESLINAFAKESTPYLFCPVPSQAPRYNDNGHLARVQEWIE